MSAPESPYPGLRPYTAAEADWFFGREGMSDAMALKLTKERYLAVIGESGCGKSSLVRAGLLPTLEAGLLTEAGSRWRVVDLRPGSDPLHALSRALRKAGFAEGTEPGQLEADPGAISNVFARSKAGENLLVLADQFEELFLGSAPRNTKAAFIGLLLDASHQKDAPIYVITTMRSDFLGLCPQFRGLPEAINQGQYLVPRMTRENLRQAIEGPGRLAGVELEPRLVQTLLNEASSEPDQLPVLQHALMRTWNNWAARNEPDDMVREDPDYLKTGRMQNALSQHADEALLAAVEAAGPGARGLAQRIFVLLRDRDVNGQEVRRPTRLKEMAAVTGADPALLRAIVDEFRKPGRTFLNVRDEGSGEDAPLDIEYDITHESFIRKWTLLRDEWIPAELNARRIYVRLARQALECNPENPSYMDGAVLDQSLEWAHPPAASGLLAPTSAWAERYAKELGDPPPADLFERAMQFLSDSRAERDRRRAEARAAGEAKALALVAKAEADLAREKESRASAKKRAAYGGIAISLAALGGVAWLAVHAVQQERHATALAIASGALLASQSPWQAVTGALLAAESLRREPGLLAGGVLSSELAEIAPPLPAIAAKGAVLVSYAPDGNRLATASENGEIRLLDGEGRAVGTIATNRKVRAFQLVADGALTLSQEQGLELWPFGGGPATSVCPFGPIYNASPNGKYVVALCDGGLVKLGPGGTRSKIPIPAAYANATRIAVSNDGGWIAFWYWGRAIYLLRDAPGRVQRTITSASVIAALGFTADGLLASVQTDGAVRQWDPNDTSAPAADSQLSGFGKGDEFRAALTGGSGNIVVQAGPRAVLAWSLSGERLGAADARDSLEGVDASAMAMAGLTSSGQLLRWRLRRSMEPPFAATTAFFSPDGEWLVERASLLYRLTATADRSNQTVNAAETDVYPVAFDPSGGRAAVRANQAKQSEPDLFSGLEIRAFHGGSMPGPSSIPPIRELGTLTSPEFSPDGSKLAALATVSARTRLRVWDTRTGQSLGDLPASLRNDFFFSPDSQKMFLDEGTLSVWGLGKEARVNVDPGIAGRRGPWAVGATAGVLAGSIFPNRPASEKPGSAPHEEQTIAVWQYPGWKDPIRLNTAGPIASMAFSPDASVLASVTADGTIAVWDWRKSAQVASIFTHEPVSAMAFAPGGRIVVRQAGRLRSYLWRTDDLFKELCAVAPSPLTFAEWSGVRLEHLEFPKRGLCSTGGSVTK